ncbi:MAG: ATP-binding protein [Isosphaeraceae bacterium]
MSYRTFKNLLGETSLERKCRFIFSSGILVLVTLSFWWYGQKTEQLVIDQRLEAARGRIDLILVNTHMKGALGAGELGSLIDELSGAEAPLNPQPRFVPHILKPWSREPGDRQPDDFEQNFLVRLQASLGNRANQANSDPAHTEPPPVDDWRIVSGRTEYEYIQALYLKPQCLGCHYHAMRDDAQGKSRFLQPGDLAGVISVKLPMKQTNKAINHNRAILITAALVTAILAMVASYAIVRYVIVKPVKHLQDVSDAIAAGRLNIRSQIQTGDEFEELSHAFNRMLHNLVAMQQELREVNRDLDRKVDELAQANLALFEMNRLKSDFLATMSHELRTPLNSIIGFSEVLSTSDSINERQRRYATNIQNSGKMLLAMINDILDLAKIESGKMEVRAEDFSIRDVCEALANLMRPMADKKAIDLECDLDEAIPLLRQDPGKIRQIVYNLLSNAIKFTPEGGRVTLRAYPAGRNVVIEVADTGIGIAAEDRDKIFEKFRQLNAPTVDGVLTREHQGTGLGLSIVRELCRLLGGDIVLDSEPGKGSTFTVQVPMQLSGNRRFEVNLLDTAIDLTKAKRVEPKAAGSSRFPLTSPLGLELTRSAPADDRPRGDPRVR